MTVEKAKKIIENEWECVIRATDGECDRDCDKCELVMPSYDIIVAYDIAMKALDAVRIHDECCLLCKHMHCDTFCDHGECFEKMEEDK